MFVVSEKDTLLCQIFFFVTAKVNKYIEEYNKIQCNNKAPYNPYPRTLNSLKVVNESPLGGYSHHSDLPDYSASMVMQVTKGSRKKLLYFFFNILIRRRFIKGRIRNWIFFNGRNRIRIFFYLWSDPDHLHCHSLLFL